MVTLYQGGLYHLYRYKKYTDVRLVFAPEEAIAFFGGDPDNFEYPRYDLDICFFRVYENGKPVKSSDYLAWSPAGLKEGDLVFVAGNPGRTDRLNTVRHLEFLRDIALPATLDLLRRREVLLGIVQPAERRERPPGQGVPVELPELAQGRLGGLAGLQDPAVMDRKRTDEEAFRRTAAENATQAADCESAFKAIDKSLVVLGDDSRRLQPAGTRHGVRQPAVRHRPDAGAHGRGNGQAQRRPAPRISRVELESLKQDVVLRGADLRRPGDRAAGRLAEHVSGTQGL